MYNITLVCTHHTEFGNCSSEALYQILAAIKPDIIFEELNQTLFDKFYKENSIPFETPEIKAVKKYIQLHVADHVPVDIDVSCSLSDNEINYLFDTVSKYHIYSELQNEHKKKVFQEGYDFLNSYENEKIIEEKKIMEKNLIDCEINRNQLIRIRDLFYAEQHSREYAIIKNVYDYSEQVVYKQAVLLIGAGHRKTIFEKFKKYNSEKYIKLNWSLFGN